MSYDKAKVAGALFDQDVSVIMAELESGPKESVALSSSLGISESDIRTRLAYLIETGFVIMSGAAYSVDSEKLAKFMENDENYKGVVDGLTELDSYLN
jgi:predicted transcriptional regulator